MVTEPLPLVAVRLRLALAERVAAAAEPGGLRLAVAVRVAMLPADMEAMDKGEALALEGWPQRVGAVRCIPMTGHLRSCHQKATAFTISPTPVITMASSR